MRTFSIFIILSSLAAFGCTENPFADDKRSITNDGTFVSGQVLLDNESDHSGVYVWIRGPGYNTRTDKNGMFKLQIPKEGVQPGAAFSGQFTVYFYLSNFTTDSLHLTFLKGALLLPQTDVDSRGNLKKVIKLSSIFSITTEVIPKIVMINDEDSLFNEETNEWEFLNNLDTVKIKTAYQFTGLDYLSYQLYIPSDGLGNPMISLIIRTEDNSVERIQNLNFQRWEVFYPNRNEKKVFKFTFPVTSKSIVFPSTDIPPGEYEFRPVIAIVNTRLPASLLQSLCPGILHLQPGESFMNIPVKQKTTYFTVKSLN